MSNIYVIVGQTASGKTEIYKRLVDLMPDLEPIITSTSRPPRSGEFHSIDYYFKFHNDFEENKDRYVCLEKFIVEPHGLCYYGIDTVLNNLEDSSKNKIVILSPSGYRELKRLYGDRVIGYYVMASEKVRRERYLSRENYSELAKERIDRRIEADLIDFKDFEFEVENIIINQTQEQLEDAVDVIAFDIDINFFGRI